jgi:Rod binding domain-containing protein
MVALTHVGQQPGQRVPGDLEAVRRAAEDFEAVFVGQLLGSMMEGLAKDGPLGGGDDPFAALLREEYGKLIARSGGIGVADAVLNELLRAQEAG